MSCHIEDRGFVPLVRPHFKNNFSPNSINDFIVLHEKGTIESLLSDCPQDAMPSH